jgi:drug/metabolite transporter (DMT)-like permease
VTISQPSAQSSAQADARDRRIGLVFAVLCSLGLGLAVASSRIAYEGGTNPVSVAMMRGWFGVALLGTVCLIGGRSLVFPVARWPSVLFLGVLMAHMNFGNIAAVNYIAVGLGALLFFVYPPLVSLFTALLDRRRPSLIKLLAVLGAFAGLVVMLGAGSGKVDMTGVLLGLTAGIACAVNITYVSRYMREIDPLTLVFYMTLVAAVIQSTVSVSSGYLTFPTMASGWWGAAIVVVCQASSIPLYYLAISKIGAEKSAVINNLQPVASIVAAWILYGELLTPERWVGAVMVLGGILLMQWGDLRARRTG